MPQPNNLVVVREIQLFTHRRSGENYLDLSNYYDTLEIIEDIYSNAIYVNLYMNEVVNIVSSPVDRKYTPGPILGNEKVRIAIESPNYNKKVVLNMRIFSISERVLSNSKKQSYVLHLVSEEFKDSSKMKISRTYKGKRYSDIFTAIMTSDLKTPKELVIEHSLGRKNVVIPHWSPFKAINWMAGRSLSPNYKGATYLFFESFPGLSSNRITPRFNYVPLEHLYTKSPTKKLITSIANVVDYSEGGNAVAKSKLDSLERVNKYDVKESFDVLNNLYAGMYGNILYQHDILNKTFDKIDFDYKKTFGALKHVNAARGKLVTPMSDEFVLSKTQNIKTYVKNLGMYDTTQDASAATYIPFRKSQIQQLANVKILVDIVGDPQLECGGMVELYLTSTFFSGDAGTGTQMLDKYYKGNFLITGINHILTPSKSYTTVLELHSDTLAVDPENESQIGVN